jgi:hypothetical protein
VKKKAEKKAAKQNPSGYENKNIIHTEDGHAGRNI